MKLTKVSFYSLFFTVCLIQGVIAQEIYTIDEGHDHSHSVFDTDETTGVVRFDASLNFMTDPANQEGLAAFRAAKKNGDLPRRTNLSSSHSIGSVVAFNVLKDVALSSPSWESAEFELKAEGATYKLWIEEGEISNGTATQAKIDALHERLGSSTPPTSIDPNKGIIENDNSIFGDPPNYDGDGKVDILVYDIKEGDGVSGFVILGFVHPADINPNAGSGVGNQRDVLYLDSNPGFNLGGENDIGSTAAHEYQHLIHLNYDTRETQFVNEALSEWAQSLNGYPSREASYLLDANDPEYNEPLFQWRDGSAVLKDYQRAALFLSYFSQRLGSSITGAITRSRSTGSIGMRSVLPTGSSFDFKDVVEGFHIANMVNDRSAGPDFGYEIPQRALEVRVNLPGNKIVDGQAQSNLSTRSIELQPGGVEYLEISSLSNFNISLDTPSGSELIRDQVRPSLAIYHTDGSVEVRRFSPGPEMQSFTGSFDKVVLICSHTNPDDQSMTITYSANWEQTERTLTNIVYDNGQAENGKFFASSVGVDNRFDSETTSGFNVPSRNAISKLFVSPMFFSQFNNGGQPETAARDFTLIIRDDNSGIPGNVLYTSEMSDPRAFSSAALPFNFIELPLESEVDNIGYPLPDRIYVGVGEAGADSNFTVVSVSSYSGDNTSFIRAQDTNGDFGWIPLQDLELTAGDGSTLTFENTTLPIRVTFVFDRQIVSNENTDIPSQFSLEQNYPNPFNPTTSISFNTRDGGNARLAVYDVTGRLVDVLYDQHLEAGQHNIGVDASSWASGMYLYELTSGGHTITKKMLLLR